ncbi:hypothetical protein F5Y16DRAFT_203547 [Xylariaceae sp. FL0255]|nr:hypothetical protein F5Y16DRAFT_203547 [Xylariaceae sp. FL0255]
MSVAKLHSKVVLSNPRKMYCGHLDPVEGHIEIWYQPGAKNPGAEVFGPLRAHVTFHGRAKTKIWKSNGQTTSVYRGRAPLFYQSQLVYDDSFKARPGEISKYPFIMFFPQSATAHVTDSFDPSTAYVAERNQPLPPSFTQSYRGWGHRFEAFVEYRVGVEINMPGLKIDVFKPTKYTEPIIHYERPRLPQPSDGRPLSWRGNVVVQNEHLLPASDQPHGFREKAKAFVGATRFPVYSFDWNCTTPRDLHLGQPAIFEVRLQPHESAAPLIPPVRLTQFSIEIKAHAAVRAGKAIFSHPSSSGNWTVCHLRGIADDNRPFSKATDWIKTINTTPLAVEGPIGALSSSFATYNISVYYTAKIKLAFTVTNLIKDFSKEISVNILPPLATGSAPVYTEAGSSSQVADEEGGPSGLPRYEAPPSYSKAAESSNNAGAVDAKGKGVETSDRALSQK